MNCIDDHSLVFVFNRDSSYWPRIPCFNGLDGLMVLAFLSCFFGPEKSIEHSNNHFLDLVTLTFDLD